MYQFIKWKIIDEKINGSFHLTPGMALEESDNGNRSAIHWDIVKILRKEFGGGEIYFDDILISSDYHTKKPDKRFFHILLERHKLDVSHSLYIGNDSRCDVGGAKGVGMPVFYVNSNISPKNDDGKEADYIVENFCAWKEVTI